MEDQGTVLRATELNIRNPFFRITGVEHCFVVIVEGIEVVEAVFGSRGSWLVHLGLSSETL
jgi:uncharacterized membrane protein